MTLDSNQRLNERKLQIAVAKGVRVRDSNSRPITCHGGYGLTGIRTLIVIVIGPCVSAPVSFFMLASTFDKSRAGGKPTCYLLPCVRVMHRQTRLSSVRICSFSAYADLCGSERFALLYGGYTRYGFIGPEFSSSKKLGRKFCSYLTLLKFLWLGDGGDRHRPLQRC